MFVSIIYIMIDPNPSPHTWPATLTTEPLSHPSMHFSEVTSDLLTVKPQGWVTTMNFPPSFGNPTHTHTHTMQSSQLCLPGDLLLVWVHWGSVHSLWAVIEIYSVSLHQKLWSIIYGGGGTGQWGSQGADKIRPRVSLWNTEKGDSIGVKKWGLSKSQGAMRSFLREEGLFKGSWRRILWTWDHPELPSWELCLQTSQAASACAQSDL